MHLVTKHERSRVAVVLSGGGTDLDLKRIQDGFPVQALGEYMDSGVDVESITITSTSVTRFTRTLKAPAKDDRLEQSVSTIR